MFKIKQEDNTDIRSKVLSLTPEDRKRLGINKSTLWYMQMHIIPFLSLDFTHNLAINLDFLAFSYVLLHIPQS